jgi:hypothetical protein
MASMVYPMPTLCSFDFDCATSAYRGEGAAPTKYVCCRRPAPGPMVFTPSPLRGEGGGGGEQRTLAKADANPYRDGLVMETTP